MIRSASGDKEFWRAEAIGDATWENRSDKTDAETKKDEMAFPENIRMDALMSIGTGASAFINPRYRGLNEGHLFQAYGWYAPNGDRTVRSEEIKKLAAWCHDKATAELWKAKPVKGQVGLLLLEDAQALCYSLFNDTNIYSDCLKGCYQAFVDSGIQADIIRMTQIDNYDMIYIPYPVGISDRDMKKLLVWTKGGGTLISEGCFGYFNDCGHAIETMQPNRGFEDVFGCIQTSVHLGPDANKNITIDSMHGKINAGVYRQVFQVTQGKAEGYYSNGEIAIVSSNCGKGKAMLVGSMPGYGYQHHANEVSRRWFSSLLRFAGMQPAAFAPYNQEVTIRLWENCDNKYAWIYNFSDMEQSVEAVFSDRIENPVLLRGIEFKQSDNNSVNVRIARKDVAVIRI